MNPWKLSRVPRQPSVGALIKSGPKPVDDVCRSGIERQAVIPRRGYARPVLARIPGSPNRFGESIRALHIARRIDVGRIHRVDDHRTDDAERPRGGQARLPARTPIVALVDSAGGPGVDD